MATRAPKNAARSREGTARPRSGTAGRPRQASTAKRPGTGGSRPGRPRGARYGKGRSRPGNGRRYGRRPPPANPIVILVSWIARVIAEAWMGLAHAAGFAARAIGRNARDLEPAHRRDGLGLTALGAAILAAAGTWFSAGSTVGRPLGAFVRGLFGSGAWTVPILLALLAWRFLRHPDRNADTARMVIGWGALIIGALGLVHIANGTPRPSAGSIAMQAAGGLIGYVVSAPLVAAVTPWVAAPLLALLTGFGLLVVTGTPLHRVPGRLAELLGFVRRGGEPAEQAEPGELEAGSGLARAGRQLTRGGRRRQEAIEAGEHQKPYDTPLLGGLLARESAGQNRPGGPGAPAAGAPGAGTAGAGTAGAAGAAAGEGADAV